MTFPSFLGIGAQRSGSAWLYRNLSRHPSIWMPPIKEIHYFDDPRWRRKRYRGHLAHRVKAHLRAARELDPQELRNLGWDLNYFLRPRSIEWYASVFRPGAGQIAGEITPAYSTLGLDAIEEIHRRNPDLKIFFFMRDPIERAWSAAVKDLARNRGRPASEIPDDEFLEKLEAQSFRLRSDYPRTLRNWESFYDERQFFVGFLEEIAASPRELLLRLYEFLGVEATPDRVPDDVGEKVNTTEGYKTEMPAGIRLFLARRHHQELEALHRRFGRRYTADWLARAEAILAQEAGGPQVASA